MKKLGEVCEIKTGNKDTQNKVENGKYPFFVRSNTVEKIDSYSYDGEAILTSGDGVGVGKNFHYINGKFDFHQRVYALRNFRNGYSGKYIYHLFSEKFYDRVRKLSAKNSVDSVRMDMISEMKVYFPLLLEQQKISSFLSLIDERIQTQNKIIEGLEKLKVATAKKIFSQEFRFKDNNGNDFSKWEEMKLKNIVIIQMGQSPDSSSYNFENIGIPLIQGNADILNRKSNPRQYTSKPTKFCDVGDLLLTVRAPVGYVGKSKHYACIGRGICSVKNNDKSILEFIYQFLLYFEDKWKSIEQGSTFTAVNSSDINSINILLPSIPEQTKIANFLSAIDSKIDMENQLLQKLEEQKKFLLQNMFV